jgi:tetratricopeptide (TPR) repeat protein
MIMQRWHVRARQLVASAALLAAACARGGAPAVTPADIPALEAAAAQDAGSSDAQLRLARAYYAAQRYPDARAALARALSANPRNAVAEAYLGLTFEELAQFDSARAVYTRLIAARPNRTVQRMMNGRLLLLSRREMQYAARQAIAREAQLAATPPDPNTVAVMPFRYVGRDSSLRPLERGLAALIVTDLSRVRRLKLVERERLQALLDEMKLVESGRVDPATGARSGRLVGAGGMVQGQFQEVPTQSLRIDATVVRATDAQISATGSGADRLQALFDIEKAVVLQLLDRMGITLTPAERVAISERPTRDLQAFLLYSRGLEASDRGDFAAAAQSFQAAARLDPSFQAASQQAASSEAAQEAATQSATDVASTVGGGTGGDGAADGSAAGQGAAGTAPPSGTLTDAINNAAPTGATKIDGVAPPTSISPGAGGSTKPQVAPNPICEKSNCIGPENAALRGALIIIIRRP